MRLGWMTVALMASALMATLALGCDDGDPAPEPAAMPESTGPTWHADVQALMTQHCAACHTAGGAAPFAFDDPVVAQSMAGAALDAIESGRMPPWQPDPDCNRYEKERIMPEDAKATLRAWVADGAPLGQPRVTAAAQTAALPAPDRITRGAAAYMPDATRPDDYRCFPLDVEFAEDTFLRGTAIKPDARALVHHVLVYLVSPSLVDEMNAMDAAEDGPGYTCYGGTGLGNTGPVGGWVPGATPTIADEGVAQFIPAGARLVMQVHYNSLTAAPTPDQTEVYLYTWDDAQPAVIESKPQADLSLRIPAGDAEYVNIRTWTHYGKEPLEVVAVTPHMHVLGKSITVEVERADGSNTCLVDIPDWDFNWQQAFAFRPGESVLLYPGDTVKLTCVYDNSAGNQPTVNGEQLEARDVNWGEGTLDEMCLNFMTIKKPFDANAADVEGCRARCDDPADFGCVTDCLTIDTDAAICALSEIFQPSGCGASCLVDAARAQGCFTDCLVNGAGTEGALASCMADICPESYTPLAACMTEVFAGGECEETIAACAP
ncbi:MAG: mono/diheme cytochrome c family protein [Bradymonadia bacterium]|jgi:mono/diheme cytochrome c family protein